MLKKVLAMSIALGREDGEFRLNVEALSEKTRNLYHRGRESTEKEALRVLVFHLPGNRQMKRQPF